MTFYDNHDMPRMDADTNGFIDANNWLFTSRGIPVLYYGSEVGFEAGKGEHGGNRNYFGQERVAAAADHPIYNSLRSIANIRKQSIALQRGLQVNLSVGTDTAVFYRVYRKDDVAETALVLLNKGDEAVELSVSHWLGELDWHDAGNGQPIDASGGKLSVAAHGVRVLLADAVPASTKLKSQLTDLQLAARRN